MSVIDTFGMYVRNRCDKWGEEYALHRDFDYLGHQSKNMLCILIEHRGEMPGRVTGFRPLHVDPEAQEIERMVADMGLYQPRIACSMRGYYCGRGRRKVERLEVANELYDQVCKGMKTVGNPIKKDEYLSNIRLGEMYIRGVLDNESKSVA